MPQLEEDLNTYEKSIISYYRHESKKPEEEDINKFLEKEFQFKKYISNKKNGYRNPYKLEIKEDSVIVSTEGDKETKKIYKIEINSDGKNKEEKGSGKEVDDRVNKRKEEFELREKQMKEEKEKYIEEQKEKIEAERKEVKEKMTEEERKKYKEEQKEKEEIERNEMKKKLKEERDKEKGEYKEK